MPDGILIIDKPAGWTSMDVCAKIRGILQEKRVGHAGTLDPMATGVLPVLFGGATKAADLLPDSDKAYRLSFRLGLTTDTQDVWGKELTRSDKPVSLAELEAVLPRFRGEILQLPPMYSAVSVGGQRLYDLARRGIEVEREARPVTIRELTLLDYDPENRAGTAFVRCSKGTYIRTVCHDIGEALGTGGIMTALCREEAAGFTLTDCITLEEAQTLADEGKLFDRILPVERMFLDLPACRLNEIQTRMFLNGVRLDLARLAQKGLDGRVRVYAHDGVFLGLADADPETQELKLKKFFIDRS